MIWGGLVSFGIASILCPMKQGPVTLSSLARLLNVHVSTVSRVLNGSDEDAKSAAAPETVQRIRDLAKQLNYRPNPNAIGLRTQRTRTIGVLVPQLSDIVVAMIYEGIDAAAEHANYQTFVSNTQDIPARQRELGESALARRVDGIMFADARLDDPYFIDEIAKRGIPMVLVSRRLGQHCSVTCDDFEGGRLAADHLVGLGHRDIAVLAGQAHASTGVDRTAGFVARCEELGVDIDKAWRPTSPFNTEAGRSVGERLLAGSRKPTAFFAVNDFLAIGLMGALRDYGMTPGSDVAVVGYNDTPVAADLPISLTSVRSPMHQMGHRGAELLIEQMGGGRSESERLMPELVVRQSSGVASNRGHM